MIKYILVFCYETPSIENIIIIIIMLSVIIILIMILLLLLFIWNFKLMNWVIFTL